MSKHFLAEQEDLADLNARRLVLKLPARYAILVFQDTHKSNRARCSWLMGDSIQVSKCGLEVMLRAVIDCGGYEE